MPDQRSLFDEDLEPVAVPPPTAGVGKGSLCPKPETTSVEAVHPNLTDVDAGSVSTTQLVQIASKAELLESVRVPALSCTRCGLSNARTNVVFGEGDPEAPIVFVGEGPGENEDATGRPFVGRAGKLLDEVLRRNGMTRKHVYICNVLKCRAADLQGTRRLNRPPTAEEIGACNDWLTQQLGIIKPIVLVCVGGPSANTLIKKGFRMMSERGRWFNSTPYSPWAIAVLHPAYILRLDGPAYEAALDTLVEDVGKARQKVIEVRREQKEAEAAPPPPRSLFD
jgi:uracil-DNA glycosylase